MTRASVSCLATAAAFAAASRATCSATRGALTPFSSTLLTTTSGDRPAWRSSDQPGRGGRGEHQPADVAHANLPARASRRGPRPQGRARCPSGEEAQPPTGVGRRPAPPLGQRGDDDGERGELLRRRLPADHAQQRSIRAAFALGHHSGMFPCFLRRQGLALVGQHPQRLGHLHAGVRRQDHRVDVPAVGGDVGVGAGCPRTRRSARRGGRRGPRPRRAPCGTGCRPRPARRRRRSARSARPG